MHCNIYKISYCDKDEMKDSKKLSQKVIRDFMMSNFNKVVLSLQKIKSKNLGQNQENLVHYLVKDFGFSNDEAEILIVDAVKANAIKSGIFNGKTSCRIVKTDNVSDATVLFLDTQEKNTREYHH